MPLPTQSLDDRRFQDILDEARRMIPLYCPEWTDHNLSDPGITLLELFAWMTDLLLYRLNLVPDRNYVKFLELIGVQLEPARPAKAELLFRLSAPQPVDVVVARGTAVATLRTDEQEAVPFATERELVIHPPQLTHLVACREEKNFHDYMPELTQDERPGIFTDPPKDKDHLYVGFANDLAGHILAFKLGLDAKGGLGIDPKHPPRAWQVWDASRLDWVTLEPEIDTTEGLNQNGRVVLHVPLAAAMSEVEGKLAFWVRCSNLTGTAVLKPYRRSPRLTSVEVDSLGALVPASHGFPIFGEDLGATQGAPGQRMQLQTRPVLTLSEGETLEIGDANGVFEPWQRVKEFSGSGPDAPHFVLDDVSGTIELGPRIRTPLGQEHQYGRVPTAGRRVRFTRYRSGGGTVGNVGADTLKVLRSPIPYISSVTNPDPAWGGTNSETIEHAKWRGPRALRTSDRAVTAEDFETLSVAASPAVGRANCLIVRDANNPNIQPGQVRVQLVPALAPSVGPVPEDELFVLPQVEDAVRDFLDERRLLTSELSIERPVYVQVAVVSRVRVLARANRTRVAQAALEVLYHYIHPTTGGPDGTGWPFERPLYATEVYALLQAVDGIDSVEDVVLYQVDIRTGERGRPLNRITPGSDGLLCSGVHGLQFA